MRQPDWWEAIVLALSAYYAFYLVSESVILERPRDWILKRLDSDKAEAFVVCPWCVGFWVSLSVYGFWLAADEWATGILAVPALACAVGLLHGEA